MTFDIKIKFEKRTVAKASGNNISDFDDMLDGLKEKFDNKKRRR